LTPALDKSSKIIIDDALAAKSAQLREEVRIAQLLPSLRSTLPFVVIDHNILASYWMLCTGGAVF
jgi:hypothetical protein